MLVELANANLQLERRRNGFYRELVSVLSEHAGNLVLNERMIDVPFPDIQLGGEVVNALVDFITQINGQVLSVENRCSQCRLSTKQAECHNHNSLTHWSHRVKDDLLIDSSIACGHAGVYVL